MSDSVIRPSQKGQGLLIPLKDLRVEDVHYYYILIAEIGEID